MPEPAASPYLAATALVLSPVVAALPLAWLRPDGSAVRVARVVAGVALIATAALGMLPEALATQSVAVVAVGIAAGATALFGVSRWLERGDEGGRGVVTAVLGAAVLHKTLDGLLLGVAASVGGLEAAAGVAIALALHELPHEMGTYTLLLGAGMSRRRAVAWKVAVALVVYPAVAVGTAAGQAAGATTGLLYAVSVGAFAYVGATALLPRRGGSPSP